ncbi:type II toxin-antitoxin system RelE/ParE family toxin [Rubellimicrobium rubrum]|uniref:Type II toxin-antitoxin system RelE/ParE family toxin n=1 Tax=Rubellimicrobium rubrum TaxID=2585369 RepID=A0A5C4MU08_9RHOB|nr:type II toxin-antitoxin system RelE/ParE family toxin [Rubellimicrobium rubrum]TNC49384.1 type II toxin-antitoxin system RelE/ParE family toxin [Rubellimicrobium rubrum]
MTYSLEFHEKALKEWKKLDRAVQLRLKEKLRERLEQPVVPSARLNGSRNRYKIKLKDPGIRLVYEVVEDRLVVCVMAVGKRERSEAYVRAGGRSYGP